MTSDNDAALMALLTRDGASAVERLDHWTGICPDEPFFYNGPQGRWQTFGELGAGSDRIANYLAACGVAPGDPVGVFMTSPFEIACIMFGIWKAGAVYAPINTSFNGDLLAYQINDSGHRIIFVEDRLGDPLKAVLARCPAVERIVLLNQDGNCITPPTDDWARPVDPWPTGDLSWEGARVANHPSDPAIIIYTSGTTGPSKGVLLPHRWMAQYTSVMRAILSRDDVIYNDLPMYHVGGSIANFVRAVWVGCKVACWERFSVSEFWNRVRVCGATSAVLLDTMIAWLSKVPATEGDHVNTLNKVHMQPLPRNHREVCARFGFDLVTTGFGQTETGGVIHTFIEERTHGQGTPLELYRGLTPEQRAKKLEAFRIRPAPPDDIPARFLGTPSVFFDVTVLDETDEPCPDGVSGELAVRPKLTHIVLKRYIGKPEATANAMRNLWFHTGDAVVRERDGSFRFVGRLGDRIRVHGENVTAFDVEDVISQHEGVSLCAAFGVPAFEGEEDDIAVFVIPTAGFALTAEALSEWANARMPRYMRPRHYRIVPDIPRTPSNKIEKYKLRAALIAELV